ncbi:hypothetical protein QGZ99_00540 [Kingella kingae]|nr:hypothetical protein [Kingella kingae]MDK4533565.1 hypothetical protein [Kingella kingae]MDK4540074.1 hypothetical protein [Kingella kingae]MDK4552610.1 hypothetical protein [Kingella kingae]UOP02240.1 hypothetical protein LVJ79_06300 [Kingella kingae]SQH25391.1 Uncharacterised protein [Kingella kingae]
MKKVLILLMTLSAIPFASAEVYSCGPGCYTSSPSKGIGRASLGHRIGSYTSEPAPRITISAEEKTDQQPVAKAQTVTRRAATASPARSVPAVAVQQPAAPRMNAARAGGRRTILEQELTNERNALAAAQQALASGRAVSGQADANHQARVRQLESAVLDRQQNIQALQRELARM